MFSKNKEKELEQLTPEAIEARRKQRSLNRVFGLLFAIAAILSAMLIYELILLIK